MTNRKQRARKAIAFYHHRTKNRPGIVLPPSVTIAVANALAPQHFPLQTRQQWRRHR